MELVEVIYCVNDKFTDELFDHLVKSRYAVTKSSAEIDTGTWGKVAVKQLTVMKPDQTPRKMYRWWDDKEVEKLNAAGTKTGRFNSKEENKAGVPKGGKVDE
jgi:hypothetical protein